MFSQLKPAIIMLMLLTILTGVVYPLLVTFAAQSLFPAQANGSFIKVGDRIVGSELIGQSFTRADYFWGRPSATANAPYNAEASGGSNLGPSNPALRDKVKDRIKMLRAVDPLNTKAIPIDLVTASASGLDPHISLAAAEFQIMRVAHARHQSVENIQVLVLENLEPRQWSVLGEPRVNVLKLNLALDSQAIQ